MLTFPGQDQRGIDLREKLDKEFDFANRVFDFWMRAPKDEWLARSTLARWVTYGAVMPLNTQACRLFQSLVELCGRGDAFSADILARSLYETALATCFVLEKEFRYPAGRVPKGAPVAAGENLPQSLRAMLYMAYQPLRTERHANQLLVTHGDDDLRKSIAARYDDAILSRIKAELGEAWTAVLVNAQNYSGLSISNLAATLGHNMGFWYKSFYFLQSRNAHGSDAYQHVGDDQCPMYFSDATEVSNALFTGASMFVICIMAAQENIYFGDDVGSGLVDFYDEYQEIW